MRPCCSFALHSPRARAFRLGAGLLPLAAGLWADSPDFALPTLTVYSQRVANQAPVATFAMPVSALRFEPRVDVQSRNFAEGQADISIRGGIFENTGFTLGAVTLFDPQTGHYFAEIPVAPAMLGAPEVVTGADLGLSTTNATVGSVLQHWRPIRTAGAATIGAGQYGLTQGEFYQGYVSDVTRGGRRLAADVAWAHSDSDGAVPFGDHEFNRVNGRVQLSGAGAQTDFFAGYQAKFFGWPNLYTPFNSNETDDLETILLALNHRRDLGDGDFVEAGAVYRRNKDEYVYDRRVGPVPPYFRHTTWVQAAALTGRQSLPGVAFNYRAEVLHDELKSTSLVFGRFHTRQIYKLALVPEWSRAAGDGARLVARAGASYDVTNRDAGEVSPVIEFARESPGVWQKLYLSYTKTSQVPTYTALNSSRSAGLFRGNPDLGRESSHNLEAAAHFAAGGWRGQAAVFHRQDDDLVDWTFRQGVTARAANAVDIATSGFEVVAQRSWQRCEVVLGYTWLTKDADYGGALVDASFYALNYARQRLTAAITARLTREIEIRLDNEVRVQAANLLRTRGGSRPVVSSLGLTYRPAALRRLALSVQVDNLWDSGFQEVPAVPAAPRQSSFSASYAW